MAGTKEGGRKAAVTNKLRHGEGFYARIGAKGGRNGRTGGFASEVIGKDGLSGRQRAIIAGAKGGAKSRRGPARKEMKNEIQDEVFMMKGWEKARGCRIEHEIAVSYGKEVVYG